MKKIVHSALLSAVALFLYNTTSAQTIQLFLEDFNNGNQTFVTNYGGPDSIFGANRWIVNKEYNGNGIYPNTTSEHNTVSGTITSPDSSYLHIYDASALSVSNCNYNNDSASDNFTYLAQGFCTLGLTNVHFSFFYIAEGTSNDYGEVYYSLDNGAWTKCGQAKYNNQTLWKYEDITLPVFANHQSVQFGFRWVNSGGGGANKMSFGVDDIIAVGTYDAINNPVDIKVITANPSPSCQGSNLTLSYSISKPLCDGTYQVYMSNAQGSFNGSTNLGGFEIYAGDTSGSVNVYLPVGASGNCFKFRIDRVTPAPVITGTPDTFCFSIIKCANTISTLQPSVTLGPDTLCDNSVIDVPFYSTGNFNGNNKYIAQLSDVNGSFANPQTLGTDSPDPNAYDPTQGSPPGTVSGLVPTTPPGCNYFIRVMSTSPFYTPPSSNYFGPFCIRQCDINTNKEQDLHICIDDTLIGADTSVSFQVHSWNNNVQYGPGNKFIVQILNIYNYTVANTGALGAVVSQTGTTINLHVPGLDSLYTLGIPPGTYYLRFISSNSNSPADTLGSLVRITMGYANPVKPVLQATDENFMPDSVFCAGSEVYMNVFPNPNYNSQYQWKSNLNFGMTQPFVFSPPLGFTFSSQTKPGVYWFMIREDNNGCFSAWSDTARIVVLTEPNAAITGNNPLCKGDTQVLYVPFQNDTYYSWSLTGDTSRIIDTSNNQIKVVFDSAGVFRVSIVVVNQCGTSSANKTFTVYKLDTTIIVTENFGILTADFSPATYQWIDCSNDQPVTGATSKSFAPTQNGNYKVKIKTTGTCTATSDCINVLDAGINTVEQNGFVLYPNPANQFVAVKYNSAFNQGTIVLTDLSGRKLFSESLSTSGYTILKLDNIPSGAYNVEFVDRDKMLEVRKLIVIKE